MILKNDTVVELQLTTINKNSIEEKWDKRVSDYENYVKEYIKHLKKSVKGNSISLSKYPYMKVKWEALAMKLDKAQKKKLLTSKQIKKVLKTQLKIVTISSE
jgi:hypothetical protein